MPLESQDMIIVSPGDGSLTSFVTDEAIMIRMALASTELFGPMTSEMFHLALDMLAFGEPEDIERANELIDKYWVLGKIAEVFQEKYGILAAQPTADASKHWYTLATGTTNLLVRDWTRYHGKAKVHKG